MRHFVFREKIVQRRLSFVHSGPFYLGHPENGGYVLDPVRGGWSLHLLRLKKASALRAPGVLSIVRPNTTMTKCFV
jgi:hypothetical protein